MSKHKHNKPVTPEAGHDYTETFEGEAGIDDATGAVSIPTFAPTDTPKSSGSQSTFWGHGHGSTSSYSKPECTHNGTKLVWECMGRKFYGAKAYNVELEKTDALLILDCADAVKGPSTSVPIVRGPERFRGLNAYVTPLPEVVTLAWKDYGVPPLTLKFWVELFNLMPEGKIIVCCVGSHGRTGTALSALMIANGGFSSFDAIQHVRKNHCKKAVETEGQEKYLDALSKAAGTYEPWEYREVKPKSKK